MSESKLEPGTYYLESRAVTRTTDGQPVILTIGHKYIEYGFPVFGEARSLKQGHKQHFVVDTDPPSNPGIPPTGVPPWKYTIREAQNGGSGPKNPFIVAELDKGYIAGTDVKPQIFTITQVSADEQLYKVSIDKECSGYAEERFMELDMVRQQVFFAPAHDRDSQLWKISTIFLP